MNSISENDESEHAVRVGSWRLPADISVSIPDTSPAVKAPDRFLSRSRYALGATRPRRAGMPAAPPGALSNGRSSWGSG
jgi:hypothetical protein